MIYKPMISSVCWAGGMYSKKNNCKILPSWTSTLTMIVLVVDALQGEAKNLV